MCPLSLSRACRGMAGGLPVKGVPDQKGGNCAPDQPGGGVTLENPDVLVGSWNQGEHPAVRDFATFPT
jgi:hypothetical protein